MKNTKRIICVLLAAFMMLGLFACKKNEEPVVTPGTESSEAPQTPAVVVPDISFYDYTVIRSESASNTLMQEIGDFYALLLARSGKQMMYDVDTLKPGQEPDPAAKEILVGNTNRPETAEALSQISDSEYIITVIGNKIVIAGKTDNSTLMALRYFTETYLGEGANGMLAGDLCYKATADIVLLTNNGVFNYTLVYGKDSHPSFTAMNKIYNTLRAITGVSVNKIDDTAAEDPNAYQILIGYTDYAETKTVAEQTDPESYTIDFIGNKIVIFAWTSANLDKATTDFISLVSSSYYYDDATGYTNISLLKDKFESKDTDTKFYKDIPFDWSGNKAQKIYDAGDDTMMLYWSNVSAESYTAYAEQIEKLGFTAYQSKENSAIKSTTYTKDDVMVHVYHFSRVSELRVVVSKGQNLPANSYEYTKVCEPALTQLECEMTASNGCGASYLIRLEDGTFVIIDGGYYTQWNASELYRLMEEQKPEGVDEIVITAWIISHPHMDHYEMFDKFSTSQYKDKVKVKMLIGQDAADYQFMQGVIDNPNRQITYSEYASKYPGCKYVKAHTGQQFQFPGVTIDMMFTHEDIYPNYCYELNNALDIVFMVTVNGNTERAPYKFLFINDYTFEGSELVSAAWGNELKCDVVQLGHHTGGGSVSLYQFADADICFCADHEKSYNGGWGMGTDAAKWALENIETWIKAFEGHYTFWFEEKTAFEGTGSVDADGEYTRFY